MLECLSFNFFGSVSEFTARFPIVLLSLLPSSLLFIICKRVKDYKFAIITPLIYKFNYNFGQNDLMKYAKIAKAGNYTISTYMTGVRYSLLYYGNQSKIEFKTKEDINWLNKELAKTGTILIIRNKYMKNLPLKVKEKSVKYSLIERLDDDEK